jgi:hypothetical protein
MELKTPLTTEYEDVFRNWMIRDANGELISHHGYHEIVRRANAHDALVAALEWYVEHDDTNDDDMFNDFWIAGRDKARAALAAAKGTV